jgi:class 3 adenylate cyclase/pimeloyl-ACP methyl ester carboxylesterase
MEPKIQFARRRDGVRIAYAVFGSGEPLVFPAGWITNLGHEVPEMKEFFEHLAKYFTLVSYDKHGCGLSDRDRTDFSLESEVHDLDTVIEQVGLKSFILFAISAGGPVSIAYTVGHSRKVKKLILYGTYAAGEMIGTGEVQSALISLVRSAWGLGSKTLADIFLPNSSPEFTQTFAKFQRESCSPETAANLLQLTYRLNVTELLSRLDVPTLVLHRKKDKVIPFRFGRQLATEIPNAVFKTLEGGIHLPWLGDASRILDEIFQFTGSAESASSVGKILGREKKTIPPATGDLAAENLGAAQQTTIVFSDIVSSTDLVTRLGDAASKKVFLQHDKIVSSQVKKHGGRELQNLGDGFMLSFASPSSAMKCACDIQKELSAELPAIKVRIGINSGEVVTRESGHPFGQAVVLASRVASKATGEQILVSDVTRQLVAGGGMPLLARGRVKLKGFPGSYKVFELDWKEIGA